MDAPQELAQHADYVVNTVVKNALTNAFEQVG